MLSTLTHFVILISMGGALWLALYLFARGFPNRIALWAAFALLSMATFFWITYNHFFTPQINTGYIKAILLSLALVSWYSATYQLLEKINQQKFLWLGRGIYLMVLITIIMLLLNKPDFARRYENELYVAQLGAGFVYYFYSFTQLILSIGLITNLLVEQKIRFTPQGRLFLFASIFPTLAVFYGIISLIASDLPMPRLIQDTLVFSGFFLLGISVARYQSLLERRTTLQDFPMAGLVMLALSLLYIFIARQFFNVDSRYFANIIGITIITHSIYDLTREFLERLRTYQEERFRKQMWRIKDKEAISKVEIYLQDGLDLFCRQMNASAGVVAVWNGEKFIALASRNSVPIGSAINNIHYLDTELECISGSIQNIHWVASIFEGQKQIAFVGAGTPIDRMDYLAGELDFLQEFADYVGLVLFLDEALKKEKQYGDPHNSDVYQKAILSAATNIGDILSHAPNEKVIKMTEEGLRKFSDYVKLGQSELAEWLKVNGSSHIDRGKKLQTILREGVEALRPTDVRPDEPLPRHWYNYVVLNDAYIKGVTNREVMARLYISEGTFNRTRRNALRGVARWLAERNKLHDANIANSNFI